MIGLADKVYAGVYVLSETVWKKSSLCSTAGFLSFLSSEVSAFLICLITLDRFLVLHFPFSQVRFRATSAHVACIITWTLGFILAMVPLLPATSHWEFYHQTGICIPLPISQTDFAGHGYSFGVIIICNLVLFLLIAMGQSLIYWSVRSNALSQQRTDSKNAENDVKSKEAVIARRLLSIAMSDFLCWFPIGVCGVLAAADVPIPGEVNVIMAIFVLPLNSVLNPFLYTLNVTLEKQQRRKELRFQKFLLAHVNRNSLHSLTLN
ncbi:relaxin receptor 2-like [Babylonia areolata]|uniref:relaxin receptor 2-like n=1 Tax=Babylonia areolata TaxID=304850 RepID=UPI003FD0F144